MISEGSIVYISYWTMREGEWRGDMLHTVEPLYKDTLELRTPLFPPQVNTTLACISTSELRTPL